MWIKTSVSKDIKVPSINSLVKSIKTKEGIKTLEIESDKWFSKYQETDYETSKYEKLYNNYEKKLCIICYTTLYYQYVPEILLSSTWKVINNTYKVLSVNNFKNENRKIGSMEMIGMR